MFSTCEVIPPDAGEPFTNDICPLVAAVREHRDYNSAAALDSVIRNLEESNLDAPDDVVPAGGSQDGSGPGNVQPPEEEDEKRPEINPTSKAKPKPKPKGLPMHQRVPEDEEVADREQTSTAGSSKHKPRCIVTVTDRGEPPFTRRRLNVTINIDSSTHSWLKEKGKKKLKTMFDRDPSDPSDDVDEVEMEINVY